MSQPKKIPLIDSQYYIDEKGNVVNVKTQQIVIKAPKKKKPKTTTTITTPSVAKVSKQSEKPPNMEKIEKAETSGVQALVQKKSVTPMTSVSLQEVSKPRVQEKRLPTAKDWWNMVVATLRDEYQKFLKTGGTWTKSPRNIQYYIEWALDKLKYAETPEDISKIRNELLERIKKETNGRITFLPRELEELFSNTATVLYRKNLLQDIVKKYKKMYYLINEGVKNKEDIEKIREAVKVLSSKLDEYKERYGEKDIKDIINVVKNTQGLLNDYEKKYNAYQKLKKNIELLHSSYKPYIAYFYSPDKEHRKKFKGIVWGERRKKLVEESLNFAKILYGDKIPKDLKEYLEFQKKLAEKEIELGKLGITPESSPEEVLEKLVEAWKKGEIEKPPLEVRWFWESVYERIKESKKKKKHEGFLDKILSMWRNVGLGPMTKTEIKERAAGTIGEIKSTFTLGRKGYGFLESLLGGKESLESYMLEKALPDKFEDILTGKLKELEKEHKFEFEKTVSGYKEGSLVTFAGGLVVQSELIDPLIGRGLHKMGTKMMKSPSEFTRKLGKGLKFIGKHVFGGVGDYDVVVLEKMAYNVPEERYIMKLARKTVEDEKVAKELMKLQEMYAEEGVKVVGEAKGFIEKFGVTLKPGEPPKVFREITPRITKTGFKFEKKTVDTILDLFSKDAFDEAIIVGKRYVTPTTVLGRRELPKMYKKLSPLLEDLGIKPLKEYELKKIYNFMLRESPVVKGMRFTYESTPLIIEKGGKPAYKISGTLIDELGEKFGKFTVSNIREIAEHEKYFGEDILKLLGKGSEKEAAWKNYEALDIFAAKESSLLRDRTLIDIFSKQYGEEYGKEFVLGKSLEFEGKGEFLFKPERVIYLGRKLGKVEKLIKEGEAGEELLEKIAGKFKSDLSELKKVGKAVKAYAETLPEGLKYEAEYYSAKAKSMFEKLLGKEKEVVEKKGKQVVKAIVKKGEKTVEKAGREGEEVLEEFFESMSGLPERLEDVSKEISIGVYDVKTGKPMTILGVIKREKTPLEPWFKILRWDVKGLGRTISAIGFPEIREMSWLHQPRLAKPKTPTIVAKEIKPVTLDINIPKIIDTPIEVPKPTPKPKPRPKPKPAPKPEPVPKPKPKPEPHPPPKVFDILLPRDKGKTPKFMPKPPYVPGSGGAGASGKGWKWWRLGAVHRDIKPLQFALFSPSKSETTSPSIAGFENIMKMINTFKPKKSSRRKSSEFEKLLNPLTSGGGRRKRRRRERKGLM